MRATYFLLFIMLSIYCIILAKGFLVPLAFGLLFGSLIYPLCKLLHRYGLPKALSIIISLLLMILFLAGVSVFFFKEVSKLTDDVPALKKKALDNVTRVTYFIEDNFGVDTKKQKEWLKERVDNLFTSGNQFMNKALNATADTIFKLFLLPVFIFYILYNRERFHFFMMRIVPDQYKKTTNDILHKISYVSQRYLGGAFIVVLILSVLNSTGLYIIGVKFALLFGVISAIFNFIPYFGTWIGAVFPFTFALLTGDSPRLALGVIILYAIIQFIENNILTPNITGGYVRLNPFITILGLIAGGLIWGVAGMLLIIPFLASLKIIFEHIESTKALAFLIGKPENETRKTKFMKIKSLFKFQKTK